MTTESRMMFHLIPALGPQVLRSITRDQMQAFLDKKAENLSRSVVDHLRWDLNSIFKTALSDGLVDSNPAAALFTPAGKPEGEKRVMSPEEIRLALSVLDTRARLIFRMAVFDGMRTHRQAGVQGRRRYPERSEGQTHVPNRRPLTRHRRRSEGLANHAAPGWTGGIPVSVRAGNAAETRQRLEA